MRGLVLIFGWMCEVCFHVRLCEVSGLFLFVIFATCLCYCPVVSANSEVRVKVVGRMAGGGIEQHHFSSLGCICEVWFDIRVGVRVDVRGLVSDIRLDVRGLV